jgi:hypothetical protein
MANFTMLLLGSTVLLSAIIVLTVIAVRKRATQRRDAKFRLRWRPHLASGPKLLLWSARLSEVVTRRILALRRTKRTATTLAREILGLSSFAIQHLPCVDKDVDITDCRDRIPSRIGVTPPEILAIADEIRLDAPVARRIHDRAHINTLLLARHRGDEMFKLLVCPLRTSEGACAAGRLCPLQCRTTCQLTSAVQPQDAAALQGVARDIRFGVEVGLLRGIYACGLDCHVYELNSALATALETPNASEKWARGESVLEGCAREDHSAYSV